jgi:hypothetical protein
MPRVRRQAAQDLRRRRCHVQRFRVLPHRLARGLGQVVVDPEIGCLGLVVLVRLEVVRLGLVRLGFLRFRVLGLRDIRIRFVRFELGFLGLGLLRFRQLVDRQQFIRFVVVLVRPLILVASALPRKAPVGHARRAGDSQALVSGE